MEKIKKYLRKKADIKSIDMNEIKQYSKILSSKLITQDIDLIIGLKTGGYIPSILISKKLNKPLKFINIGRDKKRFFGIEVEKNIFLNNIYMQLFRKSQKPNIRSFNDDGIEGKRILLIDDDALSGLTLELAKDFLIKKGAKTVITACLIIYDDSYQSDFYAYKTKRSKILFFSFNKMKFPWAKTSKYYNNYLKEFNKYEVSYQNNKLERNYYDLDYTLSNTNSTFDFIFGYLKLNKKVRYYYNQFLKKVLSLFFFIPFRIRRKILINSQFKGLKKIDLLDYYNSTYKNLFLNNLTKLGNKILKKNNSKSILLTGCTEIPATEISKIFKFKKVISTTFNYKNGKILSIKDDTYGNLKLNFVKKEKDIKYRYYNDDSFSEDKLKNVMDEIIIVK
ncbi:hypothetical protein HOD20_01695 [archaeon]|nr:hypothetical protein [Candidatus Woesearchaeota archaeon]MBT4351218.1 hypothetical protein [archaeon]MBT4647991.1 hypothetical protein [archaeon]MBT6822656.1 hypothetical protein [archaeon]